MDLEVKKPFLFTDVKQEIKEYNFTGTIKIYFTVEEASFYLTIRTFGKVRKQSEFGLIYHEKNLRFCPFCEENDIYAGSYCRSLSKDPTRKELFEALVHEPAIRLEWIYLDYPE